MPADFFPEGTSPRPTDDPPRSLKKINALLQELSPGGGSLQTIEFSADGAEAVTVAGGARYALGVVGSLGGGTLKLSWVSGSDSVPYSDGFDEVSFTDQGGIEFTTITDTLELELTGSTGPSFRVLLRAVT